VNRVRVPRSRCTDNTLTVAEKSSLSCIRRFRSRNQGKIRLSTASTTLGSSPAGCFGRVLDEDRVRVSAQGVCPSEQVAHWEAEEPCSEHTAQIPQQMSSPLLVKRGSWQVCIHRRTAYPLLGQFPIWEGHGHVVEHWEDITSQEIIGHLVGTHGSHLIG